MAQLHTDQKQFTFFSKIIQNSMFITAVQLTVQPVQYSLHEGLWAKAAHARHATSRSCMKTTSYFLLV